MSLKPIIALAVSVAVLAGTAGTALGLTKRDAAEWTQTGQAQQNAFSDLAVAIPGPIEPLDNDASGGKVVFTFDDGPDAYTQALLAELRALHLKAVFFVFGSKVVEHPGLVREEAADGDLVENHTWDHPSFTGASTDTPPLSPAKITAELQSTQRAITSLGLPAPTLYRPPFGDITAADNQIAASLGLRIVQPFSVTDDGNVTDSRDWTGISPAQIVHDVTEGYTLTKDGRVQYYAGIHGGSVIGFHDSAPGSCAPMADPPQQDRQLCHDVVNMMRALPGIVAWMNAHHLGVTVQVPLNATGGAVPDIIPRTLSRFPGHHPGR
jgi:peptidoglycan/xylan/chitin deacetylase (PgdA/CDA1 family)